MDMIKFPSIESFGHVFRDAAQGLTVRPKIKLHGTNGGIWIKGFDVIAQSRNNLLIDSDNAGFAAWVRSQDRAIQADDLYEDDEIIIYGEWAGPGIQERDAVTKIPEKHFFVFAAYLPQCDRMITDPLELPHHLPDDIERVHVLPWAGPATRVDFTNTGSFAGAVNTWVEEIGVKDPYIFETFGVEGPGEGLVFMPEGYSTMEFFCRNTFKAKTEAHRVRKAAKAVSVKIDIPRDAVDFVPTFVTDARCKQAVIEACNGNRAPQLTREFLKWIGDDVQKESKVELEGMGIEYGKVAKFVIDAARKWYLAA